MDRREFLGRVTMGMVVSSLPIGLVTITQEKAAGRISLKKGKDKNGNYYNFPFPFEAADRGEITVWYYKPSTLELNSQIVFVMPGIEQNGEAYLNDWADSAEQYNFLLIVPQFFGDVTSLSLHEQVLIYNKGNVFDDLGSRIAKDLWSFSAIENLFDYVKQNTGNINEQYHIYGHSAGGQFVHRLVLFLPEARYGRAIAANPGWYTMPIRAENRDDGEKFDRYYDYPYGLGHSEIKSDQLQSSFSRDFLLMLGDQDIKKPINDSQKANAQGENRFERGQNFYKQAQKTAQQKGFELKWNQTIVIGAGHNDAEMLQAAAPALFALPYTAEPSVAINQ